LWNNNIFHYLQEQYFFLKKYFNDFEDYQMLKDAYLYDEYKIGVKIKPIIKQNPKNIEWLETKKDKILKNI
jgi:hypothetical protein